MKRRPEGSAWLTRSWIWPALGNNCSYGLWREVLTPPPIVHSLCFLSIYCGPLGVSRPPLPSERLLLGRGSGSTQRCLGVCGVLPSVSFLLLAPLGLGAGSEDGSVGEGM